MLDKVPSEILAMVVRKVGKGANVAMKYTDWASGEPSGPEEPMRSIEAHF
jgi:hypothetical protein